MFFLPFSTVSFANWTPSILKCIKLLLCSGREFPHQGNRHILKRFCQNPKFEEKNHVQDSNPNHTTEATLECHLTMNMKSLSPSQNAELNPFQNLQNDLKTDRHRCSLSNLSKLEHICIFRREKNRVLVCIAGADTDTHKE